MNKIEIIVDVKNNTTTTNERPFTEQELAYSEKINEQILSEKAVKITRESALAKLAALGLTQDEIKALVG
jgi:hypothetical protein